MSDRVLIVDDEPIIRNGLRNFIDWEQEGLELVTGCANGMEAMDIIRMQQIDILITDIKMPVMDGLELIKHALQHNPNMKVVLISSYNEFEYVRQGLKYGAVDYLLKPTLEADELIAVLTRCKELLERQRLQSAEKQQMEHHTSMLERKRIEQEIIRNLAVHSSSSAYVDIFGSSIDAYLSAFVVGEGLYERQELYGRLHVSMLYEDIQLMFYTQFEHGIAPVLAGEAMLLILPYRSEESIHQLEQFKDHVEREVQWPVTMGYVIAKATDRIEQGFSRSRAAVMRSFFEGTSRLYRWIPEDVPEDRSIAASDFHIHHMIELIRDASEQRAVLQQLGQRWRTQGLSADQVKKEAYELLSAYVYLSGTALLMSDVRETVWRCDSMEQLERMIAEWTVDLEHPNMLLLQDKGHGGQLILKAIEHMKQHYREDLTLQDVADSIHVSKSYFSNLFKKQTGQNFIDFLIDLRLQSAKALLAKNECKVYEVAEKSGFNDVKYFSKLFKKMTQMTPMEYREKHQS